MFQRPRFEDRIVHFTTNSPHEVASLDNNYTWAGQILLTVKFNNYQLSLTNPRDALHRGKYAVNKGGRSV